MKEYIDIFIHPDGKIEMQVKGIKGRKCLDLTKDLENALGKIIGRKLTPECFQLEEQHIVINKK